MNSEDIANIAQVIAANMLEISASPPWTRTLVSHTYSPALAASLRLLLPTPNWEIAATPDLINPLGLPLLEIKRNQ